ncbi:MAG: phosphatidylglycerol lysyltransferase domain-containing protein [Desulfohalobiaceae bacterium]|nr:phosphatidylglycerol lysyltransferase domain-containing protein [Desulfohalobiaceae bacterium]
MESEFHPISLQEQEEYKAFLALTPGITSDYSFGNLWAWRDIYGLEWARAGELIRIRQTLPQLIHWAPVGPWHRVDWSRMLPELAWKTPFFTRIPEELAQIWNKIPGMSLESAPDHWDYIYSVPELIQLKGNKFHKKKNLLRQFQKNYTAEYVPLEPSRIEQALTLQTEWCLWRECEESSTLEMENQAILATLREWQSLEDVFGGGLMIDGAMAAYTVAEPLDEQTLVIHFEKACPNYKGIYQAINQIFLEREGSAYTYVNREQDLGDSGLRQAKESYNPVGYMKKYSGSLATS